MTERETRHWADGDVELELVVGEDGWGQPTGQVRCPVCGHCDVRPEDIEHAPECGEPRYTSEWDRRRRAVGD